MPITITLPPPGLTIGPGYAVELVYSVPGPMPAGYQWRLSIGDDDGVTRPCLIQVRATTQNDVVFQIGDPHEAGTGPLPAVLTQGQTAFIHAEVIDAQFQTVDSQFANAKWETTGMLWEHVTTVGAEFSNLPAQASQQLQDVWDWTHVVGNLLAGGVQSIPLASIITHPDPLLLHLVNPPFVLRGNGELIGHPTLRFNAYYGINWVVTENPGGAGVAEGIVIEWELRVIQFATQFPDTGTGQLLTPEVLDSKLNTFQWLWQRPFPHSILYSVTPGYALTCWWMAF